MQSQTDRWQFIVMKKTHFFLFKKKKKQNGALVCLKLLVPFEVAWLVAPTVCTMCILVTDENFDCPGWLDFP